MNLLDPFGRTQARDQKEYESLRATLVKSNITNSAEAEALQIDVQKRGKWTILFALLLTILLSVLFPQFRIIFIPVGALFCFWVNKTISNGKRHIRRYIDEELNEGSGSRSEEE